MLRLTVVAGLGAIAALADVRVDGAGGRRLGGLVGPVSMALAMGVGMTLLRSPFRWAWVGLSLIALAGGLDGSPPTRVARVGVILGFLLSLLAVRGELSDAIFVVVLSVFGFFTVLRGADHRLSLSGLVAVMTAVSQFGVYSAVPDTEFAIAHGCAAGGIAIVAIRKGTDLPVLLALASVLLTIATGSARDTSVAVRSLPALGLLGVIALPRAGAWLEGLSMRSAWWRLPIVAVHLMICGFPRWLIIGRP